MPIAFLQLILKSLALYVFANTGGGTFPYNQAGHSNARESSALGLGTAHEGAGFLVVSEDA